MSPNGARSSFLHLDAYVQTVVRTEQTAERLDRSIAGEGRNALEKCQQLVALEKQTDGVAAFGNFRLHRSQTGQIGHRDSFLICIEGVLARDSPAADYGRIGAIGIERKLTTARLDAHFGQSTAHLGLYLRSCHLTAGFHKQVLALEHTVGRSVLPGTDKRVLRQSRRATKQITQQSADNAPR